MATKNGIGVKPDNQRTAGAREIAADDRVRACRPLGLRTIATDDRLGVAADDGVEIARSEERFSRNAETDLVCRLLLGKRRDHIIQNTPRPGVAASLTVAPDTSRAT